MRRIICSCSLVDTYLNFVSLHSLNSNRRRKDNGCLTFMSRLLFHPILPISPANISQWKTLKKTMVFFTYDFQAYPDCDWNSSNLPKYVLDSEMQRNCKVIFFKPHRHYRWRLRIAANMETWNQSSVSISVLVRKRKVRVNPTGTIKCETCFRSRPMLWSNGARSFWKSKITLAILNREALLGGIFVIRVKVSFCSNIPYPENP